MPECRRPLSRRPRGHGGRRPEGAADDLEQALAAAPDNVDLRRQVFELLLASGQLDRAVAAAPGPGRVVLAPTLPSWSWLWTPVTPAATTPRWPCSSGSARRTSPGRCSPLLLAWARFAAGDRAEAIAQLADEKPETGLERLRTFYRAAMLGLEGRPRDGLERWRRRSRPGRGSRARAARGLALQLAAGDRPAADQAAGEAPRGGAGRPGSAAPRRRGHGRPRPCRGP